MKCCFASILLLYAKRAMFSPVISWGVQVTFGWYDDDYVRFGLDQHAEFEC